jgi:type I restriction enzyme, R subunit
MPRDRALWQGMIAGEREVKKALRRTLLKYKLHQDAGLLRKAHGYVEQCY